MFLHYVFTSLTQARLGVRNANLQRSVEKIIHLGPAVPLHSVLVVGSASLEDWLVNPSTTSNTSNHGAVGRGYNLK